MSRILQISKARVEKEPGNSKIKRVTFEGGPPEPVRMGVSGGVADFFHLKPDEPLPSTLDYVVGAVGGCLTGTLAGALEALGIDSSPGKLEAQAEGTIEEIDGRMLLTSVKVHYRVRAPEKQRAAVERAIGDHGSRCPVSESVRRGIAVEWSGELIPE
jgi:uncharacterized OsmC-like protein